MTWWGEPFGTGSVGGMPASFDLKRKSRFLIETGHGIMFSAKSVGKPKVTIESKEYRMINHYYSYPGIAKWDPITITMVDTGGFSQLYKDDKRTTNTADDTLSQGGPPNPTKSLTQTSHGLWEMLLASGYSTPNGIAGISQRAKSISSPEKASTIDNSFGTFMLIKQIDANGETIEEWKLHNPIITKISWGDLDYGDDGAVEFSIDVKYDWAELTK